MIEGKLGIIGHRLERRKIMRREGRQHGQVRTRYMATDSQSRGAPPKKAYRRVEPPAMAGRFHRVDPTKPTNHSKFTGKCGRARCGLCHLYPVGKSRSKTKGHQKHRACDILTNHRMYAWRVVEHQPSWAVGSHGFHCFGESASTLISFLAEPSQQGYCNSSYYMDRQSDDSVEELQLSLDFQSKAQISEPSVVGLEIGGTAIDSGSLCNCSSSSVSEVGSWSVEILSESQSEDDDWFFVDRRGREED